MQAAGIICHFLRNSRNFSEKATTLIFIFGRLSEPATLQSLKKITILNNEKKGVPFLRNGDRFAQQTLPGL